MGSGVPPWLSMGVPLATGNRLLVAMLASSLSFRISDFNIDSVVGFEGCS